MTWDLVAAAASQPPPAALFHLLDKTLLLKHLRGLKAEKTVNGKPFYKSYIKWEDLNQIRDPTAAALWSAALREKNQTQLDDCDGQGGTVCPFDSLASLFNDPNNIYANTCIISDRTNESGSYIPEAGMEMVAR